MNVNRPTLHWSASAVPDDLPGELKAQLLRFRRIKEHDAVIRNVVCAAPGRGVCLDEILIEIWRTTKIVMKRRFVQTRLYRLHKTGHIAHEGNRRWCKP